MSEKINDGGPAFPLKAPLTSDYLGMSLRDYFATAALQGLIAHKGFYPTDGAADCYKAADAMLAARDRK